MASRDELLSQSAVELRRRIGTRDISPVELLEACIERIERLNPGVNAICETSYERARQEAKAAEAAVLCGEPLGLLHGLPTGIKDLEETAGLLTTYGSPLYCDYVPQDDSSMVARVRAAGAVIVAKTNTPEFGAGANTRNAVWGATGNPFDPTLTAGGSSGGSAVALACDMLPVCTGSDTGGSLRIPAAMCGVVGMRPSPGLVPTDRRSLGWAPISVIGPMGRTVADAAMLFAAQAATEDSDPLSYPVHGSEFETLQAVDPGSLRVAWTEDFGVSPVAASIRQVFREKVQAMRHLFRSCDRAEFDFGGADRCFDVIRAMNFVDRFRDIYQRDPGALGPNVRANYETGARMTIADVTWAHAEQTRIFRRFQKTLREYDLVIAPTTSVTPFPWTQLYLAEMDGKPLLNYYHWLSLTYVITLVTNPAITLPCGVDYAGMPFGLQVVGRFRGDRALLGAALAMEHAFEKLDGLQRPIPDIKKLLTLAPALKSIVTHPPAQHTH
jgi:Asp-tRNA(Asn)/Glu-tRNA(Gln) amidotransferase A subunit family amidase